MTKRRRITVRYYHIRITYWSKMLAARKISRKTFDRKRRQLSKKIQISRKSYKKVIWELKQQLKTKKITMKRYKYLFRMYRRRRVTRRWITMKTYTRAVSILQQKFKSKKITEKRMKRAINKLRRKLRISKKEYNIKYRTIKQRWERKEISYEEY